MAGEMIKPVNDIFWINPNTRVITVPETEKVFGVENDGNSERKYFKCSRIVGDGIDLSEMRLYVNYINANNEAYPHLIEDVEAEDDAVTFSWLIPPAAVAYKGTIDFIVCAKKSDDNGVETTEWNTTIAQGTVLKGLEATSEITERNPDIIEQILKRLDSVNGGSGKLADLKDDAEHRTVTDAEKAAWNSKIDKTALDQAATDFLQQAKESGEFKGDPGEQGPAGAKGDDGYTPQKGVDYFDGADGKDGDKGADGVSIISVSIKEVQ